MLFFQRFKRVTSQRFIPEIDGLRFFAIMPVLFMHLGTGFLDYSNLYDASIINEQNWLRRITLEGDLGVLLFFGISGFILALPFAKYHFNIGKKVPLGKYFLRRLTRLEPPYIVTLIGFFLVHVYLVKDFLFQELIPHLGASLLYIHNIVYGKWTPINPVAWSLEIEVQFYILVPLITLIFKWSKPWRRLIFFLIILGFPLLQDTLPLRHYHLHMSIISHFQYFMVGFLFADIYLSQNLKKEKVWNWVGFFSIPLIWVFKYQDGIFWDSLVPISILLFFISAFKGTWWGKIFKNQWIATIGGMCYITYLIHYPFIHLIMKYMAKFFNSGNWTIDFLFLSIVFIPLVLAVSAISFLLLEKPFMYPDWPKRFWNFVVKKF